MDPLASANALLAGRRNEEAAQAFARLAIQAPGHPLVLLGLATAQHRLGKKEAALANLAKVRPRAASDAVIAHNVAKFHLAELDKRDEGLAMLREAHAKWPDDVPLRDDFIGVLSGLDAAGETVDLGRAALAKGPDSVNLRLALAAGLLQRGDAPGSTEILRGALASWPTHVKVLESIARASVYDPRADGAAVRLAHEAHANAIRRHVPANAPLPAPSPGARVLGVLSPDFKRHSVSHFSLPLITELAGRGWRVHCYYTTESQDDVTARFKALPVRFLDCPWMPPVELASRIRADGVGVLLDLAGLSAGHRLPALLLRPAPVQVNYLGYAATSGAAEIGARLVDALTDPEGSDTHGSERLVRLPGCFIAYGPPPHAPEPGPASPGPFTFGSFNALLKLCDPTVDYWSEVLKAVPHARLLLKTGALSDPATRDYTRQRFEARGVDGARLDLRGWADDTRHHLSLYDEVDLALDPLTYHGTTTTCEALLMGVPTLTVPGGRHASRVGASLMHAAGMPEWIAESPGAGVRVAVRAAAGGRRDLAARAAVRHAFLASPLANPASVADPIDRALRDLGAQAGLAQG
ncbi:MAG: hypothetical protein DYG92_10400 [Leptolyngbya sp. PLA1]|nr:hypothetical protein [Leptolyngbya sp. PLA1]